MSPLPSSLTPSGQGAVTWRHWLMLAASLWAATASSTILLGSAFLLPALHLDRGLSLAHAALVVATPLAGILCTSIAWGWVVDRVGERLVLVVGLAGTAAALVAAMAAHSLWTLSLFLFLAGASGASTNAASGRVVVGWFPPHRRGLALGARQMATPLGAAIAALTMPTLASTRGLGAALAVPTAACLVAVVTTLVFVADPPRPPRATTTLTASPYRGPRYLWRIHAVSLLLVVPQALMGAFLLVWLIAAHGWSDPAAGAVVTIGQLLGSAGRIIAGAWSDRLGSRMRPLRQVALVAAALAAILAVAEAAGATTGVVVVLAVALTVVSVADNGLAFTAVAEYAGPFWSGRALGIQNTGQFLAMVVATPAFGALIERLGYAAAFGVGALVAAAAVPLVPRADASADRA